MNLVALANELSKIAKQTEKPAGFTTPGLFNIKKVGDHYQITLTLTMKNSLSPEDENTPTPSQEKKNP